MAKRSRRFASDTSGAVTVEFVVALPILLLLLAFAVQYGGVLMVRSAVDGAVRDTARYLARAPVDQVAGRVPDVVIDNAENLISNFLGQSAIVGGVRFGGFCANGTPDAGPGNNACSVIYADGAGAVIDLQFSVPFPIAGLFTVSGESPTFDMNLREVVARTDQGDVFF